jgi:hydroxymethylpyrimidine pyrophosphatase-like HAD family hydrolase
MIIAVDFDGTLAMGKYPEIGSPKPYAVEVMNKLKADGHYIILWTCRRGERLEQALNWMLEQGIPFDRINAHEPANLALYGDDTRKVYAHVYIDDKQVGGLPTWPEIYDWITEEERKYKEGKA